MSCWDSYKHEREGADAYRWREYGERDEMRERRDRGDGCAEAWLDGWRREERREEERRQEEYEQELAERRAAEARAYEQWQEEQYYYEQMTQQQQYPEPEYPQEQANP